MIQLSSLHSETFYLNADLIVKIEQIPDTMITLTNGEKIRVSESPEDVVRKFIEYKRKINHFSGESDTKEESK